MGIQKVAFNFMIERGGKIAKSLLCTKPQNIVNDVKGLKYSSLSKDSVDFSETLLPKADEILNLNLKERINNSPQIIQKNFPDCKVLSLIRFDKSRKLIRMDSGFKYDDINRYQIDKKICCYLNNNNRITEALMLDTQTQRIKVVDFVNKTERNYSKDEIDALKYYKYHPDSIHIKLRHNRDLYSGDFQFETTNTISGIEKIFSENSKLSTNREKRIIYRALQNTLTKDDIEKLQKVGEIFTEKSFCSTTTDLKVAKRFMASNPVLEIEFPKGAKYIDMDKLFNIDREHWIENEFLINKGAKFQVTGFDKENNIIKVKYLI